MATQPDSGKSKTLIFIAGGVAAVVVVLFLMGGGHNDGQPSLPSGPGTPVQNDQGR